MGEKKDASSIKAGRVIDLGNSILLPGLVNAHTHSSMTFLRGLADDLLLMDWLTKHIFPVEKYLTPEIVYLGSLLGCAEMIRTGTTAFADMYLFEDSVLKAVDSCGMRAMAGEGIFAFPSPAYPTIEEGFALVREQAEKWKGHPRIRMSVMPHTVYTTSPEILDVCREISEQLDLPVHIHLSETKSEVENSISIYGKRPLQVLRDHGLLTDKTTLAHGVELEHDELDLIAEAGAKIVHNPKSNMKLASGIAPVPEMLERGIAVGLGTDGAASNNSLNMFSEMSTCALLHKVSRYESTVMPAARVFEMATTGSASCLHWDGLGKLEIGGPADIIALDLESPNLQPMYYPTSHLVYAASGHEVNFTMAAGSELYRDGKFLSIDYASLLEEMNKVKNWVKSAGK